MRTVGIDFASQPKNTAWCEVEWDGASATVVSVETNVTDEQIRTLVNSPVRGVFGIDIPFGWPAHFVQFVAAHMACITPPQSVSIAQ